MFRCNISLCEFFWFLLPMVIISPKSLNFFCRNNDMGLFSKSPQSPSFQGVSGLRSCERTHPKKVLCYICPVGGTYDKYRYRLNAAWAVTHLGRPCWPVHGSGRVCSGSADNRSRCNLTGLLEPQEAVPQALTLLGGDGFISWHLRRLFSGMPTGPETFFGAAGRVWATALCPDPPKRRHCAILVRLLGCTTLVT